MKKDPKKYKNAILLVATKDSAFTIGTLLINLKDKMSSCIDIFYIVHDGFSLNDKKLMRQIAQQDKNASCKFISFTKEDFKIRLSKFHPDGGGGIVIF
ncbi:hypothetical protein DMB92_07765 [Campylobacter sp. MIT 99-7217]|uniref:hypothetical protein n=1 Tax=Campylobacter sp. MIT 99-7217 TaxID=535091 RepID=UPI00115ABB90|nr:hypothetical protein [Campylobacter sp. MIT 99-7217]TQR30348.1 hypothetical protein DMB92_07765 [Campylobacter sp. MIT 99-7217]